MADFSTCDRATLEQFAQEATDKLVANRDEIERNRAAIEELVDTMRLALEHMERDWYQIDAEWGPSELTLDEEVANGLHPAIAAARAAITKHDSTTKGN